MASGPVRRPSEQTADSGQHDRNGLHAESAADFLQVRSVSTERFISCEIGALGADEVEEIVAGVVIAIDYES